MVTVYRCADASCADCDADTYAGTVTEDCKAVSETAPKCGKTEVGVNTPRDSVTATPTTDKSCESVIDLLKCMIEFIFTR